MTHAIRASLTAVALVSAAAVSASAAPLTPGTAKVDHHSQIEKVHETHYVRRTYVYRRSYRPTVGVYEERVPAYRHRVYRYVETVEPDLYDYEDDDNGPDTYVSVEPPVVGLYANGPRRFHRHEYRRGGVYVGW